MLGAIAGDIAGSTWEGGKCAVGAFEMMPEFSSQITDDSICTIAIADALLHNKDIASTLKYFVKKYPNMGYGGWFINWAHSFDKPANYSYSNGSAMRVASVGWLATSLQDALDLAEKTSMVSHSHPLAIKAAQTIAFVIFQANQGLHKKDILNAIISEFKWDVKSVKEYIEEPFGFSTLVEDTLPVAIACCFESSSWEECIEKCAYCGGDTDTICAMAGAMAEALYGIPKQIALKAIAHFNTELYCIVQEFYEKINKTAPWQVIEETPQIPLIQETFMEKFFQSMKTFFLKNKLNRQ